jgi:flagellar protein FlaG
MADSAIPGMVIFIASVLVAATFSGVVVDTVGVMSQAVEDRGRVTGDDLRTDIEIISDPSGPVANTTHVTVYVKNTGTRWLPASGGGLDVLVDGNYAGNTTAQLVSDTGARWRPGEVVELTVPVALTAGDHRLVVIAGADRETFDFRV